MEALKVEGEMEKVFDMYLIQENDIEMGVTCVGEALVSPTEEGGFEGERLKGRVIPMGLGVTYTPGPGRNDVDSTLLLETDDGAYILMEMDAVFDIDPVAEEQLIKGENIPADQYYFKGIVRFRTGHEKYKWLERKICVCETKVTSWERVDTAVYMV